MSSNLEDDEMTSETSPLVALDARAELELGGGGEEGVDQDTGIPQPPYKTGLTSSQADVQLKFHGVSRRNAMQQLRNYLCCSSEAD